MTTHAPHSLPIVPVILSGGMGTRLWPTSRESYPKQFLALSGGKHSLIQETIIRVTHPHRFAEPLILCNQEHRFLAAEQLRALGTGGAIMLEPCGRNTAPAIAAAAVYLEETTPGALMLVLPSDHVIRDDAAFLQGVERASAAAAQNRLVTFGIAPEYAETGYGYIRKGEELGSIAHTVAEFVEKPDASTAARYIASGEYAWNSGMFVFPAAFLLAELATHAPEVLAAARDAVKTRTQDLDFLRLGSEAFAAAPSISIDYAVMERTRHAAVVSLSCGWSDAGSWDGLWRISEHDAQGNVSLGENHMLETTNCYLRSETGAPIITTLGVEDLVIVSTHDAILVTKKERAQDVKNLVQHLQKQRPELVTSHRRVFRPWGYYDSIDAGPRHQVKHIKVKPGAKISLQMHYHRAEHWIIVAGTAKVHKDGEEHLVTENESIYIPCGAVHRIENPGKVDLDLIEVQSGGYLGEDDIVRYEDTYGRA